MPWNGAVKGGGRCGGVAVGGENSECGGGECVKGAYV